MALVTYPLNNVDYVAEDAELFHCTRNSGIYAKNDFPYSITGADNSMTIGTGIAWIRNSDFAGKVAAQKSETIVNLGVADSTYPRIDAVVIQFSANRNDTAIVVKQGTAASSPVPPEIVRTGAVYELHLYQIRRAAGATAITAADITDLRLSSKYCGLMADSVTKVNTDAIYDQAMALIDQLRADIAGAKDGSAYLMRSGGKMTGDIDMDGHSIDNVAMAGNFNMNGNKITNVATPTNPADGANKDYVDTKQTSITISSISGKSGSLESNSAAVVATLALAKGTYLVFGSARIASGNDAEGATSIMKVCITSTGSYDATKEACCVNVPGGSISLNTWALFELTAAATISLMAYHETGKARKVDNGRIYAFKIA